MRWIYDLRDISKSGLKNTISPLSCNSTRTHMSKSVYMVKEERTVKKRFVCCVLLPHLSLWTSRSKCRNASADRKVTTLAFVLVLLFFFIDIAVKEVFLSARHLNDASCSIKGPPCVALAETAFENYLRRSKFVPWNWLNLLFPLTYSVVLWLSSWLTVCESNLSAVV